VPLGEEVSDVQPLEYPVVAYTPALSLAALSYRNLP
jgi:hypothetical protein